MIKILFVCLGNICRSPAAEGISKKLIKERNLQNKILVDSAGIGAWHIGELPNIRMRNASKKRNLILDSKGRQFNSKDFTEFDYIVGMDRQNIEAIYVIDKQKKYTDKIFLITNFLNNNEKYKNGVPDPYELKYEAYDMVLDILFEACGNFMEKVIKDNNIK